MWKELYMVVLSALCVVGERGNNFACCHCLCCWRVDYRKGSIANGARRHVMQFSCETKRMNILKICNFTFLSSSQHLPTVAIPKYVFFLISWRNKFGEISNKGAEHQGVLLYIYIPNQSDSLHLENNPKFPKRTRKVILMEY